LDEIAARINLLFRQAGLERDVVRVEPAASPHATIHLDPRENEPDPMKWGSRPAIEAIVLVGGHDPEQMGQILKGLESLFAGLPPGQMRLF
jgi:hypothetical protein